MAEIQGKNIVTSGLVLHLDSGNPQSFDGNSTTWRDLSMNGNNGTLTNGVSYSSNNRGLFTYDGVDDYVIGANNLGITGNSEFTISYYAIWDGSSFSSNYPSAFGNNSTGTSLRGLSTTWKDGRVALDFWVNRFRANNTLNVKQWYHLTFTKTVGIISTSKIYVDGQIVSGTVEDTDVVPNIIDSPFIVGRLDNTRWFNGRVNCIQVYNRALSQEEITQNYNATKSKFGL